MRRTIFQLILSLAALSIAWWAGNRAGESSRYSPPIVNPAPVKNSPPSFIEASAPPLSPTPLATILNHGAPKISLSQLHDYLQANHRDAESLLAASRLTGDLDLAREAARKFPDDPLVHFALATRSDDPTEKGRAIEALTRTDPNNSLGPYLAANQAFASGKIDQAIAALTTAAERGPIDSYIKSTIQSDEDAFLAAGLSPLDASAAAVFGRSLACETELHTLYQQLRSTAEAYRKQGDVDSTGTTAQQGVLLGRRLQTLDGHSASGELIGLSTESRFLELLTPTTALSDDGTLVGERMEQIAQRRELVKDAWLGVDLSDPSITPVMMEQYLRRLKILGELRANVWLKGQLANH